MSLKDLRPQKVYTLTLGDTEFKVKYTMNSKDYLERVYGDEQKAFEKISVINPKAKDLKHFVRAFLMINYEENLEHMDNDELDKIKPSLAEIGNAMDLDTMQSACIELFNIAIDSLTVNSNGDEKGENQALIAMAETAVGALLKLFGRTNLEKALKNFGYQAQKK